MKASAQWYADKLGLKMVMHKSTVTVLEGVKDPLLVHGIF